MAVKKLEEILEQMKGLIGDNADDSVLQILEDVSDTFNSLTAEPAELAEDWEAKYNELDASWRKRYIDRFFDADAGRADAAAGFGGKNPVKPTAETIKIEDLFKPKG